MFVPTDVMYKISLPYSLYSSFARGLAVGGDVTIEPDGQFVTQQAGSVTTHSLSVGGNLTNNGSLNFSTNSNAAGANIVFTSPASSTFGGSGPTTNIRTITINKGTSSANVLELATSSFSVRGTTADSASAAYLTLTNGTFKISGTFTASLRTFSSAGYTIGSTAGFISFAGGQTSAVGQSYQGSGTFGSGSLMVGTLGVQNAAGLTLGAGVSPLHVARINLLSGQVRRSRPRAPS